MNWRIQQLFHSLGLSCLAGAVFLQILVFVDIIQQGYFLATEGNQLIIMLELILAVFAFLYFIFICQKFIRSLEEGIVSGS